MAVPAVLDAVQAAFHVQANQVHNLLEQGADGRVRGAVVVAGSPEFNGLGTVERSRRMWEHLRRNAGPLATQVGVVILRSDAEAQVEGF